MIIDTIENLSILKEKGFEERNALLILLINELKEIKEEMKNGRKSCN